MIVFIKELGLAVVFQCNVIMMRPVLVIAIPENAVNVVVETVVDTGCTISDGGILPLSKNLHTLSKNENLTEKIFQFFENANRSLCCLK